MAALITLTYIFFGLLVGYAGRRTLLGFWPVFVLCLVTTPLVMAVLVLLFSSRQPAPGKA